VDVHAGRSRRREKRLPAPEDRRLRATEQDCETVSLASPLAKEAVHEFYADRGYERWGYIFEREP